MFLTKRRLLNTKNYIDFTIVNGEIESPIYKLRRRQKLIEKKRYLDALDNHSFEDYNLRILTIRQSEIYKKSSDFIETKIRTYHEIKDFLKNDEFSYITLMKAQPYMKRVNIKNYTVKYKPIKKERDIEVLILPSNIWDMLELKDL